MGIQRELCEDHFTSAGQTVSVIRSAVIGDSLQHDDNDSIQNNAKKICRSSVESCTTG